MVKLKLDKHYSLVHNERKIIMEQKMYKAACYCRLSDDDLNDGMSVSIETQITIQKQYCKENQIQIVDFYCDDGYTGTNFERPAFKRMIEDIRRRKVDTVIVKDLSRFGREHLEVGYRSCSRWPLPEPQQRRFGAASETHTTAQGNAGYLTH